MTGSLAALASGSRPPTTPQDTGAATSNESPRQLEESSMEIQSADETPDREPQPTSPAPSHGIGRARGRGRGRTLSK